MMSIIKLSSKTTAWTCLSEFNGSVSNKSYECQHLLFVVKLNRKSNSIFIPTPAKMSTKWGRSIVIVYIICLVHICTYYKLLIIDFSRKKYIHNKSWVVRNVIFFYLETMTILTFTKELDGSIISKQCHSWNGLDCFYRNR